jgi:ADP-ribosylglycohydrolase
MHRLMARIASGENWRIVAESLFDGQGSFGNGAAMRVAPLGAFFADDMSVVIEQARQSAEITHAHEEGIAGGIAVAVAAALAWTMRDEPAPGRADFLNHILPHVPVSEVKSGIQRARDIRTSNVDHVIAMIGNGYGVTAQDTVPFALWCAGESLSHYEDALWLTASGLGDVDTNCAIVGGIVALYTGHDAIPPEWIASREPLPAWVFG